LKAAEEYFNSSSNILLQGDFAGGFLSYEGYIHNKEMAYSIVDLTRSIAVSVICFEVQRRQRNPHLFLL
jgi:hypothetical protein